MYVHLSSAEILAKCGDDASKWAAAFCEYAEKQGHRLDEGWVLSWFANAIEHSGQVRGERNRKRLANLFDEMDGEDNRRISRDMGPAIDSPPPVAP